MYASCVRDVRDVRDRRNDNKRLRPASTGVGRRSYYCVKAEGLGVNQFPFELRVQDQLFVLGRASSVSEAKSH